MSKKREGLVFDQPERDLIHNAVSDQLRGLVDWYGDPDRGDTLEVSKQIKQPHAVVHVVMERICDLQVLQAKLEGREL